MVSIAHRLSTAEAAELVLVFDQGRSWSAAATPSSWLRGAPVARPSWLGNTRSDGDGET